jgi:hypothetical protein
VLFLTSNKWENKDKKCREVTDVTIFQIKHGACWSPIFQAEKVLGVVKPKTIGSLLMPYFGFSGQELLGVTYRQTMVIGKTRTDVFLAGAIKASGKNC